MTLAPTGFGKRSTAQDVVDGVARAAGVDPRALLAGKRIVVTGASSGIGVETVRALAGAGADVVLAVRDVAAGERAAGAIRAGLGGAGGALDVTALDLADFASVRACAGALGAGDAAGIDVLLCNAGVMASPLSFTKQGFELQMGTNHLGHFLLASLLRPSLASSARVVVVASSAHTRGSGAGVLATLGDDKRYDKRKYAPFTAYGDSKLANILFARALAKRMPAGQSAFALHPGVIATNLVRHLGVLGVLWRAARPLLKSEAQGAATSVLAAVAPGLEEHRGIYLANCNQSGTSADAGDEALAEQVWTLSERLVSGSAEAEAAPAPKP